MIPAPSNLRRLLLPALVFVAVGVAHYVWIGLFPEKNVFQDRWIAISATRGSWLSEYVEMQSYWLGFSYALSLAFAAVAFRRYREVRLCAVRNLTIGSVTFSGVLPVVGCYLIGCCGSPMLAVYLNLFGAAFVPLAKPLMAGLTLLSVVIGWWWMNRRTMKAQSLSSTSSCDDPSCRRP